MSAPALAHVSGTVNYLSAVSHCNQLMMRIHADYRSQKPDGNLRTLSSIILSCGGNTQRGGGGETGDSGSQTQVCVCVRRFFPCLKY